MPFLDYYIINYYNLKIEANQNLILLKQQVNQQYLGDYKGTASTISSQRPMCQTKISKWKYDQTSLKTLFKKF